MLTSHRFFAASCKKEKGKGHVGLCAERGGSETQGLGIKAEAGGHYRAPHKVGLPDTF